MPDVSESKLILSQCLHKRRVSGQRVVISFHMIPPVLSVNTPGIVACNEIVPINALTEKRRILHTLGFLASKQLFILSTSIYLKMRCGVMNVVP